MCLCFFSYAGVLTLKFMVVVNIDGSVVLAVCVWLSVSISVCLSHPLSVSPFVFLSPIIRLAISCFSVSSTVNLVIFLCPSLPICLSVSLFSSLAPMVRLAMSYVSVSCTVSLVTFLCPSVPSCLSSAVSICCFLYACLFLSHPLSGLLSVHHCLFVCLAVSFSPTVCLVICLSIFVLSTVYLAIFRCPSVPACLACLTFFFSHCLSGHMSFFICLFTRMALFLSVPLSICFSFCLSLSVWPSMSLCHFGRLSLLYLTS